MLITMGSITTAARYARLIEKNTGVPASVTHTPAAINKGGCSYSVRIPDQYMQLAKKLAAQYNVNVRKFYRESYVNGQHEYNVVS